MNTKTYLITVPANWDIDVPCHKCHLSGKCDDNKDDFDCPYSTAKEAVEVKVHQLVPISNCVYENGEQVYQNEDGKPVRLYCVEEK